MIIVKLYANIRAERFTKGKLVQVERGQGADTSMVVELLREDASVFTTMLYTCEDGVYRLEDGYTGEVLREDAGGVVVKF